MKRVQRRFRHACIAIWTQTHCKYPYYPIDITRFDVRLVDLPSMLSFFRGPEIGITLFRAFMGWNNLTKIRLLESLAEKFIGEFYFDVYSCKGYYECCIGFCTCTDIFCHLHKFMRDF